MSRSRMTACARFLCCCSRAHCLHSVSSVLALAQQMASDIWQLRPLPKEAMQIFHQLVPGESPLTASGCRDSNNVCCAAASVDKRRSKKVQRLSNAQDVHSRKPAEADKEDVVMQ